MTDSVFCTQCGKPNRPGAVFCSQCGNPIFKPQEAVIQPAALPDFISLVCPRCGGMLKVGGDVQRLTCLNCGTTHDVIREQGGAVLRPLFEQIEQAREVLSAEEDLRRRAAASARVVSQQTAASAAQLQQEQQRQAALQEALILEQRIRENEAVIKEKGTSEKSIRGGCIGLVICLLIGIAGDVFMQNQNFFDYGETRPVATIIIGVLMWGLCVVWSFITSLFSSSREGSRCQKENQELRQRLNSLRRQ